MLPTTTVSLDTAEDAKKVLRLIDALDDLDDVQDVYANFDIPDSILETVEAENRVAVLMIGRPYHSDPGLNHGVLEEFQVLGYPILSMRSIPP